MDCEVIILYCVAAFVAYLFFAMVAYHVVMEKSGHDEETAMIAAVFGLSFLPYIFFLSLRLLFLDQWLKD